MTLVMPWAEDDRTVSVLGSVMTRRNVARVHGKGRDWETPPEVFDPLNEEFDFTLDPCCSSRTAKCDRFYTEQDDGLSQDWTGERVYMNPPYGAETGTWTQKAATSGALVVGLLPAMVDTAWWHRDVVATGAEVRYIRGRVRFLTEVGHNSPFTPVLIVVWRP